MRIWAVLGAALAIPLAALAATWVPFARAAEAAASGDVFGFARRCITAAALQAPAGDGLAAACNTIAPQGYLALAALAAAAVGVALVLLFRIAAVILGAHRALLAAVFPPFAFLAVIAAGLLAAGHMLIVAGAVAIESQYWLGSDNGVVTGIIVVVALATSGAVLWSAKNFFAPNISFVLGRPINLFEQPRLGLLIRDVAKTVKARVPSNVVLGMEPTFFATNAPVQTPYLEKPITGQTLYLSLPMMHTLTEGELRAVIGHELGHFSGGDTLYSIRFAPVYRGLAHATESLGGAGVISRVLAWPARMIVRYMVLSFANVERRIGRARELRADQNGVKASTPDDLAYSLLKVTVHATLWSAELQDLVERARQGRFSRNLARNFAERARYDLDRQRLAPRLQLALGDAISHPTDTHPSTLDRLEALGLNPTAVTHDDAVASRFFDMAPALRDLDDMKTLEEDLTALYYHVYQEHWAGQAPDQPDTHEVFLRVFNDFLAQMVTADGMVVDREIEVAEREARALVPDFDAQGFRERTRYPEELPELDHMIEFANRLLKPQGATMVKELLKKIAQADNDLHRKEERLLKRLEALVGSDPEAEAAS